MKTYMCGISIDVLVILFKPALLATIGCVHICRLMLIHRYSEVHRGCVCQFYRSWISSWIFNCVLLFVNLLQTVISALVQASNNVFP